MIEDMLERNPKLVFTADAEGRTPLHYAAALKDSGAIYDLLIDNGADEMAFDSVSTFSSDTISTYNAQDVGQPGTAHWIFRTSLIPSFVLVSGETYRRTNYYKLNTNE